MSAFERVMAKYRELDALNSAIGLMNWDQQLLMPAGGLAARSEHLLRLSRLRHAILTSDEFRTDLDDAKASGADQDQAAIRILLAEVEEATKLPLDLIERKSKVTTDAYQTWRKAKQDNNYSLLAPYYKEVFEIAKETAECLTYKNHPYDALINLYEEDSTFAEAESTLGQIKGPSIELLKAIKGSKVSIDDSFLVRDWNNDRLKMTMERIVRQIGFSLNNGRLDVANNAFCAGSGPGDVRMTTRPSEHIKGIVSSTLHEMGHGLYEQNQRADWAGTPLCGGVSLAVHESQSRTWENVIGRSYTFWKYFWTWFQEQHPFLAEYNVDQFYAAYNKVEPSFIRVGADEISYNLHILVRFEIEVEIITGKLDVKNLPEAWNAKYEEYLGIVPPTDSLGCMQDVHWSKGSIGYFPTYSYGNLIGVQIHNRMLSELPNCDELIQSGNFRPILDWLTEKVYGYGKLMPPKYLVEHIVGEPMKAQPWIDYATAKFSALYQL
ncbi:MAG: carboxypeptidase M32 [Fimbriimonadales bacterium]|nr:carboxypeptidase M32 [Fimbriimonadales bacterium]